MTPVSRGDMVLAAGVRVGLAPTEAGANAERPI
jgi:hypothetical protein